MPNPARSSRASRIAKAVRSGRCSGTPGGPTWRKRAAFCGHGPSRCAKAWMPRAARKPEQEPQPCRYQENAVRLFALIVALAGLFSSAPLRAQVNEKFADLAGEIELLRSMAQT